MDTITYNAINNAVTTVPGVKSLANYESQDIWDLETKDIAKAVEIVSSGSIHRVKVHVILMNGFNIRDVVNEVQIRVKYELEKLKQFTMSYSVDVVVDDLQMI
ncbi:hypothetical protein SCLARK_00541 [Spiroplasma clarkii]|uniref:Asp23/Gls24 family envelope stress response protein n=1 Tax=Spiroplasma clarkii TaxID=2139 RepID=A0A1Y0KZS3_9MOLU|nr:Asp23/Gls24 family envelope stress response protein [Spiroplasma clarkii]ARU91223.1 hypothetical protein SCLARK_00541 [Spiroplasma clarkii]ATX70664.1 Asp23/Gls24 family envelope stress response protein [Spiroplasma clarkii]